MYYTKGRVEVETYKDNEQIKMLGYDEWFQDASSGNIHNDFTLARVVEVNKGNYRVADGKHEMMAELAGKFVFTAENRMDFPTVGDWVIIHAVDDFSLAIIHDILPRKTLLKRKESGRKVDFQLIAANIDYGLVVQSADSLNLNCLERYLVMLNESKIESVVVVSKIDLLSASELTDLQSQIARLNTRYLLISNVADGGVDVLTNELQQCKTYCLLGPSGVGKTSLLNRLLGENLFKVNEVREKDGRGRHTTVRRQLICLEAGSIFIDTPGMRELGNFEVTEGIEETFKDIALHSENCRFKDCTHVHEEGCAIIEAVANGIIDTERYQNYLKIKKESDFYEMSYLEKRKKDKAFGKMIKNYKKQKNDKD
jgi:ribosome biogenesis GTPase